MDSKYFAETREEMLAFIPETCQNILEVGCGQGKFGRKLLDKKSVEIWGVEPHYESYICACKDYHKVINDIFRKDLELPKNYFDCVVFNDVLEHLIDPQETLSYTKDYLKKKSDSYIVTSIPNFNFIKNLYQIIIKGDFKYEDSGTLDKTHLRFFTKRSIERLFKDSGYEIEILRGINPSIHLLFKIINLITLNSLEDNKYLQYAVLAKLKNYL